MNAEEHFGGRNFTTPEGKIWPSAITLGCSNFYCIKFSKDRLSALIKAACLSYEDGNLIDLWVLMRIDHWDNELECTLCLTEHTLFLINFNFVNEKATVFQRVPLNLIKSMCVGNLIAPKWSLMPHRDCGALQVVWGDLDQLSWKNKWNPLSQEFPAAVFHHHPCFYSLEPLENKDMFDCDLAANSLEKALYGYNVEVNINYLYLFLLSYIALLPSTSSNFLFCKPLYPFGC